MHEEDAMASRRTGERPRAAMTALYANDETAEATLVALQRLQSAFVELSSALNETLCDKRSNAAACLLEGLQDAREILQSVLFPESVPAERRFRLSPADYKFLYQYMSEYPRESSYPRYDTAEYVAVVGEFEFDAH